MSTWRLLLLDKALDMSTAADLDPVDANLQLFLEHCLGINPMYPSISVAETAAVWTIAHGTESSMRLSSIHGDKAVSKRFAANPRAVAVIPGHPRPLIIHCLQTAMHIAPSRRATFIR